MLNLEKSKSLFVRIYNDAYLANSIENYINKHRVKFNFCLSLCKLNKWVLFLKKRPFFKLCLVYAYLPTVKAEYEKIGIDDKIFYDTMDDIRIWIDDNRKRTNEYGLYELNWIMLHMNLDIFKLGRLQFQKWFYYDKKSYNKDGKSISFGDKVLNIHIPRGEKMDIDECKKSIEQAKIFFKTYYPKYANCNFICHSWLLYPNNINYMDKNSNIIKFSKLFDIVSQKEAPEQAILWLFGNKTNNNELIKNKRNNGKYLDTSILKNDTSLQKSAISYIDNGGDLGDAFCVLK